LCHIKTLGALKRISIFLIGSRSSLHTVPKI
jgi:hypothetical protein